ncbi:MAG: Holliday junction resolvase RuvX [Acutalibacter sp.]|nr:Holliday junction resolvase RuvX [Acutalibacter sp.]
MILLGVDLGKVRTGLALCDEGEILASPLSVITEHNRDKLVEKITEAARENQVKKLIIGLPKNMDGSEGESAQNAREIGALLAEHTGLPIEFFDERGTTITAHGYLNETNVRGKKRKAVVDAVAAVVILQGYLDGNRSRKLEL